MNFNYCLLQGLSKDKGKRFDSVQNSFWVYSIKNNKWSCIYRNDNVGEKYWSKMQDYEPCPRYAHQLVYDHVKKVCCILLTKNCSVSTAHNNGVV